MWINLILKQSYFPTHSNGQRKQICKPLQKTLFYESIQICPFLRKAKKNSTARHPVKKDKLDVNENSFYETLIILILFSTDLRGHDNYQCVEFS